MQTVRHYWIECQTYQNEIVARIQYRDANNKLQESALYSLPEIASILELWKQNELLGSFGIGSVLSDSAVFTLTQKEVK